MGFSKGMTQSPAGLKRLLVGGARFYADSGQSDHGVTTAGINTIADILSVVGTSMRATIVFRHSGGANQTVYYLDTSLSLSSYPNIKLLFEKGAILAQVTGDELLTCYDPGSISAGETQAITYDDMIRFAYKGVAYLGWFGCAGNGSSDDTDYLQSAFNSGCRIVLGQPGRTYRHTDSLTINVSNFKLDMRRGGLKLDDATGLLPHIICGDDSTQRTGLEITAVTFTRNQVATAGACILFQYCGIVSVHDCNFYGENKLYRGIELKRVIIGNIYNNSITHLVNNGLYLYGTDATANRTVDISIRENRIEYCANAIVIWDYVEGIFCRDNIFYNTSGSAVSVNATTAAAGLISMKFQENDFDTCGAAGLYFDKVSNFLIENNWFSNITGPALNIESAATYGIVSGNMFYPNAEAMKIDGQHLSLTDNIMSGGTHGVYLDSNADNIKVCSNKIENNTYGVTFISGCSNIQVSENMLSSVGTPIAQESNATNLVLENNVGDDSAGLTAYITVGSSPFTYTAGPRPEFVSIFAGTVSQVDMGGTNLAFVTNVGFMVPPNKSITVTYSALPFMSRIIQ